jgi:hypothetical protein
MEPHEHKNQPVTLCEYQFLKKNQGTGINSGALIDFDPDDFYVQLLI